MGRSDRFVRRSFAAAAPAAMALASAVVVLTIAGRMAGPALLRQNANGATLALLGMGLPVHWRLLSGKAAGTVVAGDFPALAVASVVMIVALVGAGWLAARRHRGAWHAQIAPTTAWFAGFSAVAALVVSSGKPLSLAGVAVDINVPVALTSVAAALWGAIGFGTGALLASPAPTRSPAGESWRKRGPAASVVAAAVAVMAVGACGRGPSVAAAIGTTPRHDQAAVAPTSTSTTVMTNTTSATNATNSAPAPRSSRGSTSARSTAQGTSSAAGTVSGGAAAATGWAPALPGVYRYTTSGSTSSLLGNKAFPSITTLTVDAPSGIRQRSVRALESSNGDGFVIEQKLDFRPQGVAVAMQRLSLTQSGKKTVRTLNAAPATVVIPYGAPVGTHVEFNLTGVSISGHEVVDIVQSQTLSIAGQSVPAVLVRSVLTVTGSVGGTIQRDEWWAPSLRVPVKESLTGTMKSGLVSVKTKYDATIQNLTP